MSPHQNAQRDLLFSIPHVVASISRNLVDHDLAQCSLVDWTWNQVFTYELYRREIHDRHFTTEYNMWHPWPVSPEFLASLKRHQRLIRFAKTGRWGLDFIQFLREIQISTLKGLATRDIVKVDDFEELLRLNREVLERIVIEFTEWPIGMSRLFTTEIPSLDRLTRLRFWTRVPIVKVDNEAILGLILNNLPQSLQDLDLSVGSAGRYFSIPNDENTVKLERSSQWKHQEMRFLKLEVALQHSSSKWTQWFLWQCPNLAHLGIQSSRQEAVTAVACSVALKAGACLELETFESLRSSTDPSGVHACLKAIKPGKLKALKLMSLFGEPVLEAISLHTPYLESLAMGYMPIEYKSIQEILTKCPNLQHFSMPSVSSRSCLQLRHIWTYPWIYCQNLKTLSLQLSGGCSLQRADLKECSLAVDPGLLRLYPKAHPTVLRIYVHLSSMTGLESLKIGIRQHYVHSQFVKAGVIGLDFSIPSGLPILASLKRLRRLGFYERQYGGSTSGHAEAQIGREEVDWMMKHWPALREIQLGIKNEKWLLVTQAREIAQVAAEATVRAEEAESRLIELGLLSEIQTIESIADSAEIIAAAEQARREANTAMDKAINAKAQAIEDMGDDSRGPITDWHSLIPYFPSWMKVRFWEKGDHTQW